MPDASPVRVTVIVILPAASEPLYAGELNWMLEVADV
jgi:hypothetical protein